MPTRAATPRRVTAAGPPTSTRSAAADISCSRVPMAQHGARRLTTSTSRARLTASTWGPRMSQDQMEQLRRLGAARGISVDAGPTAGRVRNDGLDLAYLDWGGDGPTGIFLHGGSLTAHTWDLVCAALSPRIRCVALDLRGHGD